MGDIGEFSLGGDAWDRQIRSSDRPKDLQDSMIALVQRASSFYGPSRDTKVVGFRPIPEGLGLAAGQKALESTIDRLSRAKDRAILLVTGKSLEIAASLAAYVKDKTNYGGELSADLAAASLVNRVRVYLDLGVGDLRSSAMQAVHAWIGSRGDIAELRSLLTPFMDRGAAGARTVIRTELQTAYVSMVRQALDLEAFIERVVYSGACEMCLSRSGPQSKTEDSFWTHPNCACTFRGVSTTSSQARFNGPIMALNI